MIGRQRLSGAMVTLDSEIGNLFQPYRPDGQTSDE
jgi:hypothetical protein